MREKVLQPVKMNRPWRVPVVCCLIFLTGFSIRLINGRPPFSAELVYKAPGEIDFPGTKSAQDTAVSFYMYLDRGLYEEAWNISIEPDYTPASGPAPFKEAIVSQLESPGHITNQEEFVKRQEFELGHRGMWLKLNTVQGETISEEYPAPPMLTEQIKEVFEVDGTSLVRVTGHMLGACTIFSWQRDVVVANINSAYKVVLPGTKGQRQFYYQDWFEDITKIMDLRGNRVLIPGT